MWGEMGASSKAKDLHPRRRPPGRTAYLKVPSSDSIYERNYQSSASISSSSSSSTLVAPPPNRQTGSFKGTTEGFNRYRSSSPLPSIHISPRIRHRSRNYSYVNDEYLRPDEPDDGEDGDEDSLIDERMRDMPDCDLVIRKLSFKKSHQDPESLGFTIRNGNSSSRGRGAKSSIGQGIYVAQLEKGSPADKSGLRRGDQILAANHMSFIDIGKEDALEVLHSSKTLHLTVLPPSPQIVPVHRHLPTVSPNLSPSSTKQHHFSWVDRAGRPASPPLLTTSPTAGPVMGNDSMISKQPRANSPLRSPGSSMASSDRSGLEVGRTFSYPLRSTHSRQTGSTNVNMANSIMAAARESPIRNISLEVGKGESFGLMIRGGAEYGLGIFISGVERHSAAERIGLKVGDQILSVNEVDFCNITHQEGAEALQRSPHMNLSLCRLGKVPQAFNSSGGSPKKQLSPTTVSNKSSFPISTNQSSSDMYSNLDKNSSLSRERLLGRSSGSRKRSDKNLDNKLSPRDENVNTINKTSDSSLMLSSAEQKVDKKAAQLLNQGERLTLSYYHNEYETRAMTVDAFVAVLLELLETPQKYTLMTEIRNLIRPEDIDKFDELIYRREVQAMKSKEAMKYATEEEHANNISPSRSPRDSVRKSFRRSGSSNNNPDLRLFNVESKARSPAGGGGISHSDLMFGDTGGTPSEDSGVDLANGMMGMLNNNTYRGSRQSINSRSLFCDDPFHNEPTDSWNTPYSGPRHSFDLRAAISNSRTGTNSLTASERRRTMLRRHSSGGEGVNPDERKQRTTTNSVSWAAEDRRWSIGSEVPECVNITNLGMNDIANDEEMASFEDEEQQGDSVDLVESPEMTMPAPLPVPIAVPSLLPPSVVLSKEEGAPAKMVQSGSQDLNSPCSLVEENNSGLWLDIPSHPMVRRYRSLPDPHAIGSPQRHQPRYPTETNGDYDGQKLYPGSPLHHQHRSASMRLPGHRTVAEGTNNFRVTIKKSCPLLGIAIEGGFNTTQPLPRIISIHASGAAFEAGGLKVGQIILEVDGVKMIRKKHEDAAKFIADSFYGTERDQVEFLVTEKAKTLYELRRSSCLLID